MVCYKCAFMVFFFKQKTAYGLRISDLSSDGCSSDLLDGVRSEYSNMVFNQQTLCWEGGEVDLAGFDTDSDGYTGHEDNWDKDFDDDGALIQERLHTNGTGFSDLLSKVIRRNLAGGRRSRQELTMENVNRHKAKHPQRPILITPEDVNIDRKSVV